MKTLLFLAALVAAVVMLAASGACAGSCGSCPATWNTGGSCNTPAWDRTPICVEQPSDGYSGCNTCPPSQSTYTQVDPWAKCGAFCSSGQMSPGWPYGWNADYWLRPDSNR